MGSMSPADGDFALPRADVALEGADFAARSWPARSYLGSLPASLRQPFVRLGVGRRYQAGEVLLREGEQSTHAILILSGRVKVTARTEDGGSALLALRSAGDTVGELAATDGQPRVATVSAVREVGCRQIEAEELNDFLLRHPEAAHLLLQSVAKRLRSATQRRTDFAGSNVLVRIARVLLALGRDYGQPSRDGSSIAVELTQPELGSMTGASLAAVQKAILQLKRAEIVTPGYRSISIRDEVKLWRLAYPEEPIPY